MTFKELLDTLEVYIEPDNGNLYVTHNTKFGDELLLDTDFPAHYEDIVTHFTMDDNLPHPRICITTRQPIDLYECEIFHDGTLIETVSGTKPYILNYIDDCWPDGDYSVTFKITDSGISI